MLRGLLFGAFKTGQDNTPELIEWYNAALALDGLDELSNAIKQKMPLILRGRYRFYMTIPNVLFPLIAVELPSERHLQPGGVLIG